MAKNKVIITCAITGSIHTPSMSPHLPVTPAQIADNAIGAAEAGAAIVHLHARNPETGRPDQSPEAFGRFLPLIKQRSNVVINLTSGGAPQMRVEERVVPAATLKPEVASLNMGSMNFALYPMLGRYKEFKHDWEAPYLEGTRDLIFRNTFKDIEYRPEDLPEQRHALRIRMLRHRPPVQSRAFPRARPGETAAVRTVGVRHPRRHRHASRGRRCTCAAPPTACSAVTTTAGRCWAPAVHRCRSPPCPWRWAAMSASASKTRCGSAPASWRSRMPNR